MSDDDDGKSSCNYNQWDYKRIGRWHLFLVLTRLS